MRYAGLKVRFWALAVDFLFLCLWFFPITRVVKGVWIMSPADHRWVSGWFVTDPLCIIFLAIMFAYCFVLEGLAGATLGKYLFGLRVVNMNGGRPGLAKAVVRNALRLIDGLPAFCIVGVILIWRSPEKARFGDRISGTRVVRA